MLFAGMDTHKESVSLCIVDEKSNSVKEACFSTDDFGLQKLALTVCKASCVMEACSTSYPIYDLLLEKKVKVKLGHSVLMRSFSGLKKTDKLDARKMALMLKAGFIPEVYVPSREVRMKRDLIKQHISLVKETTRDKNRVKAFLLRYRIKVKSSNLFGKRANWLEESTIPAAIRPLIKQSLDQIQRLGEEKKKLDKMIETEAKQNNDAVLLQSIPGVGWFTAFLVAVAVDGIERFASPEQLVSYAGLAPCIYQSGNTRHTGSITKTGRAELRWALTQCAWIAVTKSKKFRKKYLKIKRKRGQKKAIISVARKMLTVMYYLLKKKEVFRDNA